MKRTVWINGAATLFVAFALVPKANSTVIIAFVEGDRIFIATDAMSSITKDNGFEKVKICKIYQSGSTFFAFAGVDQNDNTGYVASEIAKRNMILNLKGRAEHFTEDVKGPLLETLQRAYQASRQKYRNFFPGNVVLETTFVGIEESRAVFYEITMRRVEDQSGKPIRIDTKIQSCPGDSCPPAGTFKILWLGVPDAARAEYDRMVRAGDRRLNDDVTTLEHLIETQIAASPDKVGPPVAILMIDASGGQWIVGGKCGPQEKQNVQSKPNKPPEH